MHHVMRIAPVQISLLSARIFAWWLVLTVFSHTQPVLCTSSCQHYWKTNSGGGAVYVQSAPVCKRQVDGAIWTSKNVMNILLQGWSNWVIRDIQSGLVDHWSCKPHPSILGGICLRLSRHQLLALTAVSSKRGAWKKQGSGAIHPFLRTRKCLAIPILASS